MIHIENQWAENGRTMDGHFFHKNAHNGAFREHRGNLLIVRGMYIHSPVLGLSGQCDIVEFHKDNKGVPISGEEGIWIPYPVEYKRGHKKPDFCDAVQVCAQAMCLEEMYCCDIREGAIFYGESRRRQQVVIDDDLRNRVKEAAKEMHEMYLRGTTPKAKKRKACESCSLLDLCIPELDQTESVEDYLQTALRSG